MRSAGRHALLQDFPPHVRFHTVDIVSKDFPVQHQMFQPSFSPSSKLKAANDDVNNGEDIYQEWHHESISKKKCVSVGDFPDVYSVMAASLRGPARTRVVSPAFMAAFPRQCAATLRICFSVRVLQALKCACTHLLRLST
jgi:hypothetical protein